MRILRTDPAMLELLVVDVAPAGTSDATADLVEDLPEPYRAIIEAVFWEQVSRRALAKRLGIRRSALERLFREALDMLLRAAPGEGA